MVTTTLSRGREIVAIPGPSMIPDRVLSAMHRAMPNIYEGELLAVSDRIFGALPAIARTSGRPFVTISVSLPSTSMVRRGCRIDDVGFTAKRTTTGWPVEMPPRMPPAWFERKRGRPSFPARISSAFSSPERAAAAKPSPISTPFTALMLIIADARSWSSLP